jgi:peptidoglycan/xylan/chitin deacetylase (PgdA/CDA1 family)
MSKTLHLNGYSGTSVKVLMYHRVVPVPKKGQELKWQVTQSQFRKHLIMLDKLGYTFINFRDYSLFLDGNLTLPRKPIILTFDDGYEEVYNYALPVMKELGVRATVFVLGDRSIMKNEWDEKSSCGSLPLMTDQMILELHKLGFEIGSHTMSHPDLTKLTLDQAWTEISESKSALENLIQAPVISFSYPFGACNSEIENLVKLAGYNYGCAVFTGHPEFSSDHYNIRRITVTNSTGTLGLALNTNTSFYYFRWFLQKLQRSARQRENSNSIPLKVTKSTSTTTIRSAP